MNHHSMPLEQNAPDAFRFYRAALDIVQGGEVPFLVGGAYAFAYYTGIVRHTKDLDLFVRPTDAPAVLRLFSQAGFRTELVFSHWLGKVFAGEDFIDIIFNSGNGVCNVDEDWFRHGVGGEVFGKHVTLMPAEEMIWQKAYIMERERFDGADVIHLLRARGSRLDWDRLLRRFGRDGRILLSHLVLFGFVYPGHRDIIPARVMQTLLGELENHRPTNGHPICQGPLLSRMQYLPDIEEWGYADPRRRPEGTMSEEQIDRWTDAGR